MSFIKSSIFYEYLYSPKSFIHKRDSQLKIYICFLQLCCLLYSSTIYFNIFIIILFIFYQFVYIPKSLKNYFSKIIIFFIFFMIINIEYRNVDNYRLITNRKVLQLYPFNKLSLLNKSYTTTINELPLFCFYLPLSVIRLLAIGIVYLFLIKLLLLTTHYNQIIKTILINNKNYLRISLQILDLEILISSQFLNVICYQIQIVKTAYIIRNIKLQTNDNISNKFYIYLFFLQQCIFTIYENMHYIANTLYSRDINTKVLNLYN